MLALDELDVEVREGIAKLASDMGPEGVEREYPTRSVMALLGDRWSPLILLVLATGVWRHADLRRVTAKLSVEKALSQRIMTLKLRALERDGFVARAVTEDVPPKVSYSLTPLGESLVAELRSMIDWLNRRKGDILDARCRYDHNP